MAARRRGSAEAREQGGVGRKGTVRCAMSAFNDRPGKRSASSVAVCVLHIASPNLRHRERPGACAQRLRATLASCFKVAETHGAQAGLQRMVSRRPDIAHRSSTKHSQAKGMHEDNT